MTNLSNMGGGGGAGTSSMVAAICYAWLLENRKRKNKGQGDGYVVVPVMNIKRSNMWKHYQAAWLFHHVGLDANSLLFADEVIFSILLSVRIIPVSISKLMHRQ